jgi:2-deoxy-D-gluconate 3-dehydrogenase
VPEHITKYISTYWAFRNVRCNTLALGAVLNGQPKYLIKNVKKRIPLNRWAKKDEYKSAIKFLADEDNAYMTGQTLIIDGGRTIW